MSRQFQKNNPARCVEIEKIKAARGAGTPLLELPAHCEYPPGFPAAFVKPGHGQIVSWRQRASRDDGAEIENTYVSRLSSPATGSVFIEFQLDFKFVTPEHDSGAFYRKVPGGIYSSIEQEQGESGPYR